MKQLALARWKVPHIILIQKSNSSEKKYAKSPSDLFENTIIDSYSRCGIGALYISKFLSVKLKILKLCF